MPARAVVAGGGGAGGVSSAALPARSPALPASAPVPAVAERCFQGLHGVGAGAAVGGGGQGGNAQMGGHAAASGSLKRGRDDGSPDSSGLTKVQRDKIALADMVLAADKIIRECFSKEDQHEQGGFRYVQPISDLARGVVEKRLPFGCPEMIRLAVIARNLDPVITQAKSIRFTTQFKLTTWEGSLHSLKGSSARVVYDVRRGRQDPSDTSTTSVFQLFKTGELLPSIASLERFVSIQAKKASEAPP
ncbi:hypothetical protein T484DRAFT_1923294 [Baffinella frigidus]|nr:hypothetical protein T484DRAFT_1923294 [Cryptophyta sp. CCMP2293]